MYVEGIERKRLAKKDREKKGIGRGEKVIGERREREGMPNVYDVNDVNEMAEMFKMACILYVLYLILWAFNSCTPAYLEKVI